jgi:hypothetical protein
MMLYNLNLEIRTAVLSSSLPGTVLQDLKLDINHILPPQDASEVKKKFVTEWRQKTHT